ncbi:hypothetical protein [Paraburkholderia dipogonis]
MAPNVYAYAVYPLFERNTGRVWRSIQMFHFYGQDQIQPRRITDRA